MASNSPVVLGYKYRVKRSQRYFEGLRILPPWGGAYFEPYFRRTFEAYTTLWRYQQTHRAELEQPDGYNMQRCEIGEIASKIGQLFYFYYLRTSDMTSLNESFTFYEGIRVRQYFKTSIPAQVGTVLHKKLRYYARYVVVALLKNYRALALALLRELTQAADDARNCESINDTSHWAAVLNELTNFLKADRLAWLGGIPSFTGTAPAQLSSSAIRSATGCSYRLHPSQTMGDTFWNLWHTKHVMQPHPPEALKLTEAVLVANKSIQVKFSELTLDMLRIVQSLEWEGGGKAIEKIGGLQLLPPKVVQEVSTHGDPAYDAADAEEEQNSKADAAPAEVAHSAPVSSFLSNLEGRQPSESETVPTRSALTPSGSLLAAGASAPKLTGEAFNPNPRKALLYRPTYPQLSYVLSTAMLEMETRSMDANHSRASFREALLIFLSGDAADRLPPDGQNVSASLCPSSSPAVLDISSGARSQPIPVVPSSSPFKPVPIATPTPQVGPGIFPSSLESPYPLPSTPDSALGTPPSSGASQSAASHSAIPDHEKDKHSFYLDDLMPFTRNPCFLIVDSEASATFNPRHNVFGQPLVCLMAPQLSPGEFSDPSTQGSIFTYFLTHPVLAFMFILHKTTISIEVYQEAVNRLQACFVEDLLPMLTNAVLDASFQAFLTNDFTRLYILRFIFCKAALIAHPLFQNPAMLPSSYPELPHHLFGAPSLKNLVEDLHTIATNVQ